MSELTYYELLGIEQDATPEEIKLVYRKLAKKYHPDANKDNPNAADRFKKLNDVYEILSDEAKRAAYDQSIVKYVSALRCPCTSLDGDGVYLDEYDLLVQEDVLENGGGDINVDIFCLPAELIAGAVKDVKFTRKEVCESCSGTGAKQTGSCEICDGEGNITFYMDTENGVETTVRSCKTCRGTGVRVLKVCHKCSGKGMINVQKAFKVPVPKNSRSGSRMVKKGEGNQWRDGKRANGDLRFTILLASLKK